MIGTFEEDKQGGFDKVRQSAYWLYINEANEVDFKGKQIPMMIYDDRVNP